MDSLLANYASSDEEEQPQKVNPPSQNQVKKKKDDGEEIDDFFSEPTSKSFKFSLPPPKSSSSSLNPQPLKPQQLKRVSVDDDESKRVENREKSKPLSLFSSLPQPTSSSSLFSSLPQPKTHVTDPQKDPKTNPNPSMGTSVKRVVQFRPPLNPSLGKDSDDDEDEDEEEKEKRRRKAESFGQTASVKSFLSAIPAPKNSVTLGALHSSSGTGRRSIIDTSSSASGGSEVGAGATVVGYNEGSQYVDGASMSSSSGVSDSLGYAVGDSSGNGDYSNWGAGNENYANYDGYSGYGTPDNSNWGAANGDYPSYGSDYGSHGNHGHYENNWSDVSAATIAPASEVPFASELRLPAKRGRKDVPPQIVEVNQDELMKNRPREDQVKMTGIAFGPSYQPASTKGKPSKLHKRKHQIGSLYFDMKQKETELAERRSKGFLTKAQTQGKYGW